ncbi:transcription factor MYB101-like [Tripterygium wilfordii]|uniref:transcription factor MYB101-like n=1 Tax=Tripterygium wilfordii TaxID=458696 RepID=UPI0018F819B7|nr:transcription factor MYB101-like [Tripterygium wilfordii]
MNHLSPKVNPRELTKEECETIMRLHVELGNKWSMIARMLPGRTDDQIKSYCRMMGRKRAKLSSTPAYVAEFTAASFCLNNTDIDIDSEESVQELMGENFDRECAFWSAADYLYYGSSLGSVPVSCLSLYIFHRCISVAEFHIMVMAKDEWVRAAMTDDMVVVELLVRVFLLKWGMRQPGMRLAVLWH